MAKNKFLDQVKEVNPQKLDNVENYDNDKKIETFSERKSMTIGVNVDVFKEFRDMSFNFYRDRDIFVFTSMSDFFVTCVLNLKEVFLEKYGEFVYPTDDEMTVYTSRGRRPSILEFFPHHHNTYKFSLNIYTQYFDLYYLLLHTYFVKEYKRNLPYYSNSLFFYDFVEMVKDNLADFKPYKNEQ